MEKVKIEISLKTIAYILLIALVVWVVSVSKEMILLIFASYIIASALFPTVNWLSTKMSRPMAVLILFIIGFLGLTILFVPFVTVLMDEMKNFTNYFPVYDEKIRTFLSTYQQSKTASFLPDLEQVMTKAFDYSQSIVMKSIDITMDIVAMVVTVFTIATIVAFILLDAQDLKKGFLTFFPKAKREHVSLIVTTITKRLGGYMRGQILVMILVGLITGVVLAIMKVPFALLLGILAGVLEVVPVIGPIIAAIIGIIIAASVSPLLAFGTGVAYFIVQRVQNAISPFVYGKFLDMPPLVILCVIMIAATTLGVFGVILSPAIAATIYVLIQELYLKKINIDEPVNQTIEEKPTSN